MSINHDVDDSSDGPQSDVDDTNDDDSWSPLNSIVKRKTFELGLRGSYTDWSPQEAFRELVQNWYGHLSFSPFKPIVPQSAASA